MSRPVCFCSMMWADQPATRAQAKMRREERRRDLGDVEHDRRPELDVRGEHAVGMPGLELLERGLLERLSHLDPRRLEVARGLPQDAGAGILGAVDTMPEAHDSLASVEQVANVLVDASVAATSSSILSTRVGAPPWSGPESAPTAADIAAPQSAPVEQTTRAVNVEALAPCSAAETQYESIGAHVSRIGFAAPAEEEPLGSSLALGHTFVGHTRLVATRRLGDEGDHRGRETGEVVSCLRVVDVDELAQAPVPGEGRRGRLEIGHRTTGANRQRDVLRPGHPGVERIVDEQSPDLLVRLDADELLDVDAPIPERAALPVRLGDLRLEGDDPFEAWPELVHDLRQSTRNDGPPKPR